MGEHQSGSWQSGVARCGGTNFFHLVCVSYSRVGLGLATHAALCVSGISASTFLMSPGPYPVMVRLCFGLVMPAGPMGPCSSSMGADVDGLRCREVVAAAMIVCG